MDKIDHRVIPPPPTTFLYNYITNPRRRPRRDARGSSGGTLTLRRSSTTPLAQSTSQAETPLPSTSSEIPGSVQQPYPQLEQATDLRYSKNQLLDIFKAQQASSTTNGHVSRLYENNWDPGHSNGTNGRSGWGKSSDGRDTHGPDVCWDSNGNIRPIGLESMSDLEKNVRLLYSFGITLIETAILWRC